MNENVIGLAAVLLIFGTPVIAILTSHQRKMAELFQSQAQNVVTPETQALRDEVRELKQLVYQQAITLDNLQRPLPTEPGIQSRIG